MVNSYNKDTHLTLDDIAAIYKKDRQEAQHALRVLGVGHTDTYRPPDRSGGRPNNLYLRSQVEKAMRHIEAFQEHNVAAVATTAET